MATRSRLRNRSDIARPPSEKAVESEETLRPPGNKTVRAEEGGLKGEYVLHSKIKPPKTKVPTSW